MGEEKGLLHGAAGRYEWFLTFDWHRVSSADSSTRFCFALFTFGMRKTFRYFVFDLQSSGG